jgi:hypothetical protein
MQSMMASLDAQMAEAEIAANAERDQEAADATPTAQSPRQEAQPPEADDEVSEEEEDSVPVEETPDEDEPAEEDADEDEDEEPHPVPVAEQPKYSRRDAARFAADLEARTKELEETRRQLASHQGEVGRYRETDNTIRRHLQQQSGYVTEANGRFRYENLSEKVLKGTATIEEQEEVTQMTQWHEFAAPIFRAAEDLVLGNFKADWDKLKELEGVGAEGQQKLDRAPTTAQAARELHAMAFAAGESKAKQKADATIAKLRAENKSLKTQQVARAPQPATPNGAAVPSNGSLMQRMLDPTTGLPNPEFDREVAQGKWLGVDLETA